MSSFQDGNSRPQTAPTDIKKDDKYPTESEETDEGRRKGSKSPVTCCGYSTPKNINREYIRIFNVLNFT